MEVETISSSHILLPFMRCLALRFHLEPTLLSYSHQSFFDATISIVVEPSAVYSGLAADCLAASTKPQEFPAIHEVFSRVSPHMGYITLYIRSLSSLGEQLPDRELPDWAEQL